jgi:hypothetical protein
MLDVIPVCCLQWLDEDMLMSIYVIQADTQYTVIHAQLMVDSMLGKSDTVIIA